MRTSLPALALVLFAAALAAAAPPLRVQSVGGADDFVHGIALGAEATGAQLLAAALASDPRAAGRQAELPSLTEHDEHTGDAGRVGPRAPAGQAAVDICPALAVHCVLDGDWRHPVGELGRRPFCRAGVRCNQCDEAANTRECNARFDVCGGACEAYGPIPF